MMAIIKSVVEDRWKLKVYEYCLVSMLGENNIEVVEDGLMAAGVGWASADVGWAETGVGWASADVG